MCSWRGGFFLLILYFSQAFEADFGILRRADEGNELLERAFQLPHHILYGQHHAQGHLAFDDGFQ